MEDLQSILRRLGQLEQQVLNKARMGRVAKGGVRKDEVRVEIGVQSDGTPLLSPWLKTGNHHGFISENTPYEEGQLVFVSSMDGQYNAATVAPAGPTTQNPTPEDADTKKVTRRIREPREAKTDVPTPPPRPAVIETGPANNAFSGGQTIEDPKPETYEAKKDDNEKDLYTRTDHEGHYLRKKALKQLSGEPDPKDGNGRGSGVKGPQSWTQLAGQAAGAAVERLTTALGIKHTVGRKDAKETASPDDHHADSIVQQTAGQLLHKVGAAAKVVHEAENWLRQMAEGSSVQHTAEMMLRKVGVTQHLQGLTSLLRKIGDGPGAIQHLMDEAGNKFLGGMMSHNGADIGDTHRHFMGRGLSGPPLGGSGAGGGGGGGTGGAPVENLEADNVAFAYAQFEGHAIPVGTIYPTIGRVFNVLKIEWVSVGVFRVTLEHANFWNDANYRVIVTAHRHTYPVHISPTVFDLHVTDVADVDRLSFQVYP